MESLFRNFKLDNLDDDWIRSVWDAEFMMYDKLPDEYAEYLESDDARLLLHESYLGLKAWIATNERKQEESETEFSWQTLMIQNINIRGLLATLGYIMKCGQRADTDEASRQACLKATSLYLVLLAVPGSNAFGIYHPNLYRKAIETLKLSEHFFPADVKNNREMDATSNSNDDEFSEPCVLPHAEKLKLTQGLNTIISDLITMLKSFRFKEHAESLNITIRILLDVTRLKMHVKFQDNYKITALSQSAFAALRELCSNNHGTVKWTIMLIVQCTMSDLFHNTNAQPKSITIFHEAIIYFLKGLLEIHERETTHGIVILIHQLMVKCPERLEGRQKQAAVLIKLLNICNETVFATVFQDLILFSYNGKISYRLFAQEIIGRLLTESPLSSEDLSADTKAKTRRVLLAVVSSRCMDRSPLVRGKAMTTLAAFSDCGSEADKGILKNIFAVSASDKKFPGLNELKGAMHADADPLPGSSTLIAMLLERVNDERALVRRSALKILRNLSIMFPSLVSKTTHVMSDRCRDLTLTVRQFAVHVFSELLEQFPHDSSLLDEWIQAVVPQIYDIEAKVQEKVLECLQSVVLNRITSASSYVSDAANSLPWRVLNKLSSMRMRKHLSKACSLWVKNGVVGSSLISRLQSHIGTDNTVGAWILLAAVAQNMKIPNISKYIADYKEVIQKNDFHASLVLDVLRHTWSVLDRGCLEDLHRHLYERVRRFEINFNLISVCLDILSGVLRHLHGEESGRLIESNMTELMRLSEAEIRDLLEDEDGAQHAFKTRAIFTLGHASLLCTSRVSSSTLRTLERLLLQRDALPITREMRDLQAAAVILLCQQALRDREIAQEVTPIFGSLMRRETNPDSPAEIAVKVNAAKALADICVRFTALVEPYLPDMCVSMKDSNPAVREAIIVIFIQLLLEDFIKLKGPFFFHILTMLSDANAMIRELTIFLVEERLLAKNKTLISQQFLESIYHYNNYQSRNAFCGHRMHERERMLLTLPGRANQAKRNVIYEFMLEHLDAPARFQLLVKLTKYILREMCIGDSIDVTTDEGACVLRDTMFIIGNSRLQLSSFSERHKDDTSELDETTPPPPSGAHSNNAANAVVAAMKKHNSDHLLPMLITLKKKLAALKSPLEDDVESQLFKTYSECDKDHLFNLFNEYPELEKEMDSYQRRQKDKSISENDDGVVSSPVRNQDSLLHLCNRKTPRILLRRLSSSMISHYKNDGSVPSDKPDSSESITAFHDASPSEHLERMLQTPPPEPNFSASGKISQVPLRRLSRESPSAHPERVPPISTRVFNPDDASARSARSMKRPSSEREVSPDIPRKVSRSSVSRC
ncbi:condensin-2 complex subunit D3-L [Linepithema humile]|uniref:condensin-2 complex subunit D3-L n=1 Tax=Linepithema humile TaxID=83485 RepID=UPI00351DACE8